MEIPTQLKQNGIRFVLLESYGKRPFQQGWQNKKIFFDSSELLEHLNKKGNYGVMGGNVDGEKNLLLVDFDNLKVQEEAMKLLPETFTVKTGSGMYHLYYFSNGSASFKIFDEDMNTLADVQGEGKQVVGPGSTHPNGNYYEIFKDINIASIEYAELKAILMPFDKKPSKKEEKKIEKIIHEHDDNFLDEVKLRVSVRDVLDWIGIDTSLNPTQCPFHHSKGGKCLGFKGETAHCFHCDGSWNIFSLIKEYKKCDFKEALEILVGIGGLEKEYEESKKRYIERKRAEQNQEKKEILLEYLRLVSGKEKNWADATEILVKYIKSKLKIYTTKDDIKSEMWIYKDGIYIPQGKSEIRRILREILEEQYNTFVYNQVIAKLEPDTFIDIDKFFSTCYKDEIAVENGILNIMTLELSPFDPAKIFFSKIPVKYDPSKKCEKIDKFLQDVLSNKEDIRVFYELAGFSFLKEYKFEKAIMMVGPGRNGKGKTIELLKRLIGVENCCSVPLSSIKPDSFSISELFGKMLNLVGDIGGDDLKETGTFKHVTGRDLIGGKRKFLRDLHFVNYAKFVFACNELPMTYDMTRGFWDRWILLEFPYTFVSEEEYNLAEDKSKLKIRDEDIIQKITISDEMSGLLNKALEGLHRLLIQKGFSTTKGCEEVKSTWIRKSNSFVAFCFDFLEDSWDSKISKKKLRKYYTDYCKAHNVVPKSDTIIKRILEQMFGAVEVMDKEFGYENYERFWSGIKFKD